MNLVNLKLKNVQSATKSITLGLPPVSLDQLDTATTFIRNGKNLHQNYVSLAIHASMTNIVDIEILSLV